MDAAELKESLADTAFAFRGYNVTNLGRSRELLQDPAYQPIVERNLRDASEAGSEFVKRRMDLVDRIQRGEETTLATYDEAIALILAMEQAQVELLREHHGVDIADGRMAFGYSLGEIGALVAGGVIRLEDALHAPLELASDCVELSQDVTLGVLFSRGDPLPNGDVQRLCQRINQERRGVIGISAYLAPNSLLLLGQAQTVDRYRRLAKETFKTRVQLRKNPNQWPPLHTPIVWERCISDRSSRIMHGLQFETPTPTPSPPILSLVTGEMSYNDLNLRKTLREWTDHTQLLWDAVYYTLSTGVRTVLHVGPEPNIIPATYKRLTDNVEAQIRGKIGLLALSTMVRRPWLKALLPQRTALLRAPAVQHVVLEDWLLDHSPAAVED